MLTHTEGGFGGPSSSSVELKNHAPARFWFVRCCVTVRGGGGEKRNTGADGRVRVDLFLATFDCFFFLEGTAAGPTERSGVSQGQLAAAFLAVRSDKVATHTDTR